MVYEESLAGWMMENSPRFLELYDQSIKEMIRRDRNHPSVVIWGLLNETNDGRSISSCGGKSFNGSRNGCPHD